MSNHRVNFLILDLVMVIGVSAPNLYPEPNLFNFVTKNKNIYYIEKRLIKLIINHALLNMLSIIKHYYT